MTFFVLQRLPDKHMETASRKMHRVGASLNQIVRLTGAGMAVLRKEVG